MEFRKLQADEIEARVSMVKPNGVQLLLYKDARCDMNILDETVGSLNWKREHVRDNANCIVSIWDPEKNQWVSKEDTGTESNTEKEKGLASDSFKRACFNWGIGRELYTAPFIWFKSTEAEISGGKCDDRFSVADIQYDGNRIQRVDIQDDTTGIIKTFGIVAKKPVSATKENKTNISSSEKKMPVKAVYEGLLGKVRQFITENSIEEGWLARIYNHTSLNEFTEVELNNVLDHEDKVIDLYDRKGNK